MIDIFSDALLVFKAVLLANLIVMPLFSLFLFNSYDGSDDNESGEFHDK